MGLQDRDYYRDEQSSFGGINLGGARMMVTNLVIINAALFLADLFFGGREHWITNHLTITPAALLKPWLWYEFISYGFAHSYRDIWHILGNMLGLWIFGRDIELIYGRKEILRIYMVALVLGSLFWTVREYLFVDPRYWGSLLGASGAVTAVILLFVFHFPRRTILLMFVLPVPAWVLGVMIIVGNLLSVRMPGSAGEGQIAFDVHLVGAVFAICYYRFRWNLGWLVPSTHWLTSWRKKISRLKPRPALKVHSPDSEDQYRDLDERADRVLAKLYREGESSLTGPEREILEAYSRRMRQKHR